MSKALNVVKGVLWKVVSVWIFIKERRLQRHRFSSHFAFRKISYKLVVKID